MIQLANDPNASRNRPSGQSQGNPSASDPDFGPRRGRAGHAWPFLSRYAARPVQQASHKPSANDNGS